MSLIENFINGQNRSGDTTLERCSPLESTKALDSVSMIDDSDSPLIEEALQGAQLCLEENIQKEYFPLPERIDCLRRLRALVAQSSPRFCELMMEEIAKPMKLSQGECDRALATIDWSIEAAQNLLTTEALPTRALSQVPNLRAWVERRPRGVILAITPYNFPLNLSLHKIAPAIALGAPAVLKPSPKSAGITRFLVELCQEAGVPEGFLNLLHTNDETTMKLCQDQRFSKLSFTGSAKVGWEIDDSSPVDCTLELGGNASAWIDPSADLKQAAKKCAQAAFSFAGQSCISTQNIFVEDSVYDNFRILMMQECHKIPWGLPSDPTILCSAVIDRQAAERIQASLKTAQEQGVEIATQAEPPKGMTESELSKHPTLIPPTVLENCQPGMEIVDKEIFAPIVNLIRVAGVKDWMDWAIKNPYRLQCAIFTKNYDEALSMTQKLPYGGVMINEATAFRLDSMPYGGCGESGKGREGPREVIEDYAEKRVVVINSL